VLLPICGDRLRAGALELRLAWRDIYLALLDVASSPTRSNIAHTRVLLDVLERRATATRCTCSLTAGRPAARPVTGEIRLPGVAATSDTLADPETHAKILANPRTDTCTAR
jgi:hypothetical protein